MSGHPPIESLLEARDGEAPEAVTSHVASCPACAAEVERLRDLASALRGLPELEPRRDGWPDVKAALEGEGRTWIPRAVAGTLVALAASILLLVVLPREGPGRDARESRGADLRGSTVITDDEIAALVRESQRLEDLLRAASARGQVVDAWSASRVADIQDRVAFIDAQLAGGVPAGRRTLLWRTRVGLMSELVQARTTRPQYVEF
jgi:hypothetical protein